MNWPCLICSQVLINSLCWFNIPDESLICRTWSPELLKWMVEFLLFLHLMDPCHKRKNISFLHDRFVALTGCNSYGEFYDHATGGVMPMIDLPCRKEVMFTFPFLDLVKNIPCLSYRSFLASMWKPVCTWIMVSDWCILSPSYDSVVTSGHLVVGSWTCLTSHLQTFSHHIWLRDGGMDLLYSFIHWYL